MPMQKWTCNVGPKHVWSTATRQCNFMGWNLKIQTIEIVWISTSTDGLRFKLTSIPWKSIRDAKSLGRFCFEWAKKLSLKGVSWSLLYYALCLYMYLSWRVCVNISLSMVGWNIVFLTVLVWAFITDMIGPRWFENLMTWDYPTQTRQRYTCASIYLFSLTFCICANSPNCGVHEVAQNFCHFLYVIYF